MSKGKKTARDNKTSSRKHQKALKRKTKLQERADKTARGPEWLPFAEVPLDKVLAAYPEERREIVRASMGDSKMYVNNKYQVTVKRIMDPDDPAQKKIRALQMTINSIDLEPVHDWREIQRIKNAVAGEECEAVQLFPAESRLVDANNSTYLFCAPPCQDENGEVITDSETGLWVWTRFPIGFQYRMVSETPAPGCKQRPWPKNYRPTNLTAITNKDVENMFREAKERAAQAAQDAFPAVRAIQDAPDALAAFREALRPNLAALEEECGRGYIDKRTDDFMEGLNERIVLMRKPKLEDGDLARIMQIGQFCQDILKEFHVPEVTIDGATDAGVGDGNGAGGDHKAPGGAEVNPAIPEPGGRGEGTCDPGAGANQEPGTDGPTPSNNLECGASGGAAGSA
jgi:hypothetical protein